MRYLTFISLWALNISALFSNSLIQPGDHVAIVGNTFADQFRTHGYLETYLIESTMPKPISLRNLGWAGDTLSKRDRPTNFPSHSQTLTSFKTSIILAFFGFGESFEGQAGIEGFKEDLETFIQSHEGQSYNGTSKVRLVFVSPIAYESLGELTPNITKRNNEIALYSNTMQKYVTSKGYPFIDILTQSQQLMQEKGAPKMTNNGIHLNKYGYWAISRILGEKLTETKKPWNLSIDATGQVSKSGIETTMKDKTWPNLAPPIKGKIHASLRKYRDTLKVKNLKPGQYTLTIDGQPVANGSEQDWAKGKIIDSSPAHSELNTYRENVLDKNQQFIYSWKALNQVHIVGERRKSSSGLKLPAEVIKFNELSIEKELQLKSGMDSKNREYRLIPQISESLLQ